MNNARFPSATPSTRRRPSSRALAAGGASAALVAIAACGSDAECTSLDCAGERAVTEVEADDDANAESGGDSFFPDQSGGSSGDAPALNDGDACRQVAFGSEASPVNVHIVLDRSVSMNEPVSESDPSLGTRWEAMTQAIRDFVNSPQASGAKIGLQFFGLTNGEDDCSVEKYMTPAVEVGYLADVRDNLLAALDATQPGSLTPTAPALAGALAHAREVAQLPENEGRASVVVLASDGLPSECFPRNENGDVVQSYSEIIDTLETFADPPEENLAPIRTYIVGTQDLSVNADTLATAGGGQAFLVGTGTDSTSVQADFLDALLTIVLRPLTCTLAVPQEAPDTGERIDFDQVRVNFKGASSGLTREIPRSSAGASVCTSTDAWYYDDPAAPTSIVFCPRTCENLGAGDVSIELGCEPVIF